MGLEETWTQAVRPRPFAEFVDELVDVQLFEAQDDPGKEKEVRSDAWSQRATLVWG